MDIKERTERYARRVFIEGYQPFRNQIYAFESHRHPGMYFCGYVAPYLTGKLIGDIEAAWLFSIEDLERQWKTLGQYFTGTFEPVMIVNRWEDMK